MSVGYEFACRAKTEEPIEMSFWVWTLGGPELGTIGPSREVNYCDECRPMSVCLSVCLYVRRHISGTTRPIFTILLCVLLRAIAIARSYSVMCFRFMGDVMFAHNGHWLTIGERMAYDQSYSVGSTELIPR